MTRRGIGLDNAIERAREAHILGVAERLGARLKKAGGEWVGPCPRCGGCDRFAINATKQIFNCRRCGVGGDAIALASFVCGLPFADAVAVVSGEKAPLTGKSENRQLASQPFASPKTDNDRSAAAARIWAETSPSAGRSPRSIWPRARSRFRQRRRSGFTRVLNILPARDGPR